MSTELLTPFDDLPYILEIERPPNIIDTLLALGISFGPKPAFGIAAEVLDGIEDRLNDILDDFSLSTSFDTIVDAISQQLFRPIDEPFQPETYVSNAQNPNGYNIEVEFEGFWTETLKQGMINVVELISDLVEGDLPDVGDIDDLRLTASLDSIDGEGGSIGFGGPTAVRTSSILPYEGLIQLDPSDLAFTLNNDTWEDLLFHEVMHVMGFGTTWDTNNLVQFTGGALRFTGDTATAVYNDEFDFLAADDNFSFLGVPVEQDGPSTTSGSHWDEEIFTNEIMTGFLDTENNNSHLTLGVLQDIGYDTILG